MFDAIVLLEALADGHFCSGSVLAKRHGVSRTTIAEGVKELERRFDIVVQRVPGRGYRLARPVSLLDRDWIVTALPEACRSTLERVEVVSSLDSTNTYLMSSRKQLGKC